MEGKECGWTMVRRRGRMKYRASPGTHHTWHDGRHRRFSWAHVVCDILDAFQKTKKQGEKTMRRRPRQTHLLHAIQKSSHSRTVQPSVDFGILNGVCDKLKPMHVCDLVGIHLANRASTAAHIKQDGVVWGLLHV